MAQNNAPLVPYSINVPGGAPQNFLGVAMFLTQFCATVNGWIKLAANAINNQVNSIFGVIGGTGISATTVSNVTTISLENTAVTPGSYTNTALTVNAQGQLTAASSGAAPQFPGGSTGQVQYNDAGTFAGSAIIYSSADSIVITDLAAYGLANTQTAGLYGQTITGLDGNGGVPIVNVGTGQPNIGFFQYNGTVASPTAITNGQNIGSIYAQGAWGTAIQDIYQGGASITFFASQNWSSTANGATIEFATTPNNTTSGALALTLGQDQSATFTSTVTATGYITSGTNIVTGRGTYQSTSANPTGSSTSATVKMMGLNNGISPFTPVLSGRFRVTVTGDCFCATLADGGTIQIYFGTGNGPANAAGVTGTAIGSAVQYLAPTVAGRIPFCLTAIVTTATPGTSLWFDVGLDCNSTALFSIANVTISADEL